jgi:hypothetical protein
MANELAVVQMDFDTVQRVGKAMVSSGYFSDARDVAQAIVKIMAGQEMGLGAFSSMTGIHIIKGKPVLGANLIATLIKQHPHYDYRVRQLDDNGCVIAFYENREEVGVSSFTAADAKAAGLSGDNWRKFPRNMYFARAISNGAKWFTPGVFGGAAVYTADELGANVDEEGEIIDVTPSAPVVTDDGEIVDGQDTRGAASPAAQASRAHLRPGAEVATNGNGTWKAGDAVMVMGKAGEKPGKILNTFPDKVRVEIDGLDQPLMVGYDKLSRMDAVTVEDIPLRDNVLGGGGE